MSQSASGTPRGKKAKRSGRKAGKNKKSSDGGSKRGSVQSAKSSAGGKRKVGSTSSSLRDLVNAAPRRSASASSITCSELQRAMTERPKSDHVTSVQDWQATLRHSDMDARAFPQRQQGWVSEPIRPAGKGTGLLEEAFGSLEKPLFETIKRKVAVRPRSLPFICTQAPLADQRAALEKTSGKKTNNAEAGNLGTWESPMHRYSPFKVDTFTRLFRTPPKPQTERLQTVSASAIALRARMGEGGWQHSQSPQIDDVLRDAFPDPKDRPFATPRHKKGPMAAIDHPALKRCASDANLVYGGGKPLDFLSTFNAMRPSTLAAQRAREGSHHLTMTNPNLLASLKASYSAKEKGGGLSPAGILLSRASTLDKQLEEAAGHRTKNWSHLVAAGCSPDNCPTQREAGRRPCPEMHAYNYHFLRTGGGLLPNPEERFGRRVGIGGHATIAIV